MLIIIICKYKLAASKNKAACVILSGDLIIPRNRNNEGPVITLHIQFMNKQIGTETARDLIDLTQQRFTEHLL